MESLRSSILKSNILLYEYFVVFILIFYAGKASLFVLAIQNWDNPLGLMLPVVSVMILGLIKGIHFNHNFWFLMFGYSLYFVASTIKFGELHPRFFLINIIFIGIVYIVMSGLRSRFFKIYEDILYYLCIIALLFWFMMNLIPTTFIEFLRNFEFSTQGEVKGNVDFNIVIFTVNNYITTPDHIIELGGIKIFRNAGFAWEPGAFATYINLAIFYNLIRKKFQLRDNKHLWIFIAALSTTFSTTGYSAFLVLVLFYIYNLDILKIFISIPIIVVLTSGLFMLPFMAEKITKKPLNTAEELVYYSAKYNNLYTPQRFQSLQIDFIDFLNNPILGYGGHNEASWTNMWGAKVTSISGFGQIMAQYGLVGILFFLISLWQSSRQILTVYNIKGIIFPFLFLLLISLSYGVFSILFMCFWLICFSSFYKDEVIRRYTIRNILGTTKV